MSPFLTATGRVTGARRLRRSRRCRRLHSREPCGLLFVLALTVWLVALIGTELGSLRGVLAERRTWAIHSAVGATRKNLRLALLARGLKTLAVVCGLGLVLAAATAEILVRFRCCQFIWLWSQI